MGGGLLPRAFSQDWPSVQIITLGVLVLFWGWVVVVVVVGGGVTRFGDVSLAGGGLVRRMRRGRRRWSSGGLGLVDDAMVCRWFEVCS